MGIAPESIDMLTILSLSTHEHDIYFHLFMFLKNFFWYCLIVFSVQFTSLVKCFPWYFTLLDATVNETAFLISFFRLFIACV